MLKLFEIPVYAVGRKSLSKKDHELRTRIESEHPDSAEKHISGLAALVTYPYRLWEYNHIVGYIGMGVETHACVTKAHACVFIMLPCDTWRLRLCLPVTIAQHL